MMIGKIKSWNGSSGTLLNVDEGDTIYPFALAETIGDLSIGDVVNFDAALTGSNPLGPVGRATNVTRKT
jgi:hypothetical protein